MRNVKKEKEYNKSINELPPRPNKQDESRLQNSFSGSARPRRRSVSARRPPLDNTRPRLI